MTVGRFQTSAVSKFHCFAEKNRRMTGLRSADLFLQSFGWYPDRATITDGTNDRELTYAEFRGSHTIVLERPLRSVAVDGRAGSDTYEEPSQIYQDRLQDLTRLEGSYWVQCPAR